MHIASLPFDIALEPVLSWCLERGVDRLLAVCRLRRVGNREEAAQPEVVQRVNELFGSRVLTRWRTHRWPGTELIDSNAWVYVVRFDAALIPAMASLSPRVFDWLHSHRPRLPEDLCLFRAGQPWPTLITITHEREGFWLDAAPPARLVRTSGEGDATNLLIPKGSRDFVGGAVSLVRPKKAPPSSRRR